MNVLHYDDWKDTDAVETMVYFLDAVITEFLTKLEEMRDSEQEELRLTYHFMKKAYKFAKETRSLGLGILGLHSLYQSKMVPFESIEASVLNAKIFKDLKEKSYKASEELAKKFGEPKILKGYSRRNATLLAVAP